MKFARENLSSSWRDAQALLLLNHEETGLLGRADFNPNHAGYQSMEHAGVLRVFTARDGGEMKGYAVFFVMPHLHYPEKVWATQDVIYMAKESRGISGVRFIRFIDDQLMLDGVDYIYRHVPSKADKYSRTLKHFGYQEIEACYMRELVY